MVEYQRRVISYGEYYFDIDSDRFGCKKCGFTIPNEDEMIKHTKEEHLIEEAQNETRR